MNFTESFSSSTWLFERRVKLCAEALVEPGDTSYAHQGPQLLKTQLPKRTDTCGVGMCVWLSRFPGDRAQLPHSPRLLHCLCCLLADHKVSTYWGLQRMQPTRLLLRISRCEKHFFICLLIFIHSKAGIVGGSKQVSHDQNHQKGLLCNDLC